MNPHFILTRFNSLPIDPIQRAKKKYLDETWLRERLDLMDRYYRRSLAFQTCPNFQVIVAIHPDSPAFVIDHIKEFAEVIKGQITDFKIPPDATTTRLDSDDMVHREFIHRIQTADGKLPLLVDFHTAQYRPEMGKFYRVLRSANNSQFLSVKGGGSRYNCYMTSHTMMPRQIRSQRRVPIFGGVQVIHGSNIFAVNTPGREIDLDLRDYLGEL